MRGGELFRGLLLGLSLLCGLPAAAVEAPALVLAEIWRGQGDVARYLVSEKLDGVRAFWDGRVLRFRSGGEIKAPAWFLAGLPAQPLDGELWLGRGSFERLSGLVRRDVPDEDAWRAVRYMLFELPGGAGTFRQRAAALEEIVTRAGVPWLGVVEQATMADRAALERRLQVVVAGGGEGLMLHRADAAYAVGRSDILLKLKPWLDAEATVIGHRPGKGGYAGRLGALLVRAPDGREFALGSGLSDELRRNPPPVGTVVTYRYRDLTNKGMPRFASFQRLYID